MTEFTRNEGHTITDHRATTEDTRIGSEPVTVDTDIHAHMLGTYASLRLLIVVVTAGFLLTLTGYRLFGGDTVDRESISSYYHHGNAGLRLGDVFIGALSAVGLLLIAYQGYTDRENWALNIGGFALLCVVAFPMDWDAGKNAAGEQTPRGYVHFASAIVFFLSLGYVGLYRAHDSLGLLRDGPRKMVFKNLYRVTGMCMWAVPAVAVVLFVVGYGAWVYAVEYFGVCVFLAYWLVKSRELKLSLMETREGLRVAGERAVGPKRSAAQQSATQQT